MELVHQIRRGLTCILHRQGRVVALGVLLSLVQSATMLPVAWIVKQIFDVYLPARDEARLLAGGATMVGLLGCTFAAQFWGRYAITRSIRIGINRLREDLSAKLHQLPRSYYDRNDKFRLHDTIMHDMERVENMAIAVVGQMLPAGVVALTLGLVDAWLNWQLCLVIMVLLPAFYWLARRSQGQQRASIREYRQDFAASGRQLTVSLRQIEYTRLHALAAVEQARQKKLFDRTLASGLKMALQFDLHLRLQQYALAILTIVILIVGGLSVATGRMSLGGLLSFYAVATLLATALREIANAVSLAMYGYDSLLHVQQLLELQPNPPYRGTKPVDFRGHLTLRDVTFAYESEKENLVLAGASLELTPGSVTVLTGTNGSGKSTIIYLLLGFYRPQHGGILADGIAYDELDLGSLRRQIGVVVQEPLILEGTIRENIAGGMPDADQEALLRASRLATAHEFISALPAGYETPAGSDGGLLSGGQRQRIAVARALLRQPRLLIFDEPTNHIDNAATAQLLDNLRALDSAPAILVVTHDARVIASANRVYELAAGRLRALPAPGRHTFP